MLSDAPPLSELIPPEELERYRDAEWALHDPTVQTRYDGLWVVAYERRIIAHGSDPAVVLEEAKRLVAAPHRLVFSAREDPNLWVEGPADNAEDFPCG